MYISLDWINELVSLEIVELDDLINKLTLGGFEVEEVLELTVNNQKRTILDISATANRADSLSVKGIAKEIIALTNKPAKGSKFNNSNFEYEQNIQNTFNSFQKSLEYSTFVAITIENLDNFTIPRWLTEKLICSGIEPSNNLLDFQAYLLLETGYPFEFYDLTKIQNKLETLDFSLSLSAIHEENNFIATNDLEYKLNKDILTLNANNYPLSISGIITNKNVCYTTQTKSLLIEASIFNSKKIRQQSRALGLRTDRSARYEKGLNNSHFNESLLRLIQLLRISNPNLICKIHTTSQTEESELPSIVLHYDTIIEILGPVCDKITNKPSNLLPNQITEYLTRLNFIFSFNKKDLIWFVEIPRVRMDDIEREIDLIEEIGRLHGFNKFVTNLPNIYKIGKEDFSYQVRKKLTSCFLNEGFNELIQYSLVNEQTLNTIKLVNPLLTDCSTLRTTLLPNLIRLTTENLKQGNSILEGFEYGHVFSGDVNLNYIEKEVVSGVFGGLKTKREWNDIPKTLSWFEAKGKIEELFKKLNIEIYWKVSVLKDYKTILHPYRTAELYLDNDISLGIFGQIHPVLAKRNNISVDLFLFEFNLEIIKNEFQAQRLALYQQYSLYPKITKDLSFLVDRQISFDQIKKTILNNGTAFLQGVKLLDEYRGNSIPETQTSLCIQLTFQSSEKTLITKEVDNILQNIQSILKEIHDIILRM